MLQLGIFEGSDVDALKGALHVVIPIRTTTGLNSRENPFVRSKRVKRERQATRFFWHKAFGNTKPPFPPPYVVTLIRVSPGTLADSDGVVGGLKGVRDQVAEQLGLDDGPRSPIVWRYDWRKGPWGVIVFLQPKGATP